MDDLISRHETLQKFRTICELCGKDKEYNGVMCGSCYLDDAITFVEDAPSALPELTEPTYEQVCLYCEKRCLSLIDNGLLKKYESAQPQQMWIPCSERLPKNYGNYLVTYRTDPWEADIGTFDPSKANSDNGAWSACDANGFYFVASKGLEVCAWMPLPEPYAERRTDEAD